MKTILNTIVDQKQAEVKQLKSNYSIRDFESFELFDANTLSFTDAFKQSDFGIIAELKRKSPSAGTIQSNLNIKDQSKIYEKAGAIGISCLTDQTFFGGSNEDLTFLKKNTQLPILRKEFIIDEIQIFEAKAIGADAILLISEILEPEVALHFTIIAHSLGLEVIMEAHDRINLSKINEHADIIGINNRNLHMQTTSLDASRELFDFIPNEKICISESGIKTRDELIELDRIGYHGALIGESILKQDDPQSFIRSIRPNLVLS